MRRRKREQGPPWSYDVELAEGCNRLCNFCGLNAIRTAAGEDIRLMGTRTAQRVAVDCSKWTPETRIQFSGHGEPLLHPRALEVFTLFREMLPKAQLTLTTNGRLVMRGTREKLRGIFRAGIDTIIVDTYEPERFELHTRLLAARPQIRVRDYYDELVPAGISPWVRGSKLKNTVVILDDLGIRSGETKTRVATNAAGHGGPATREPLKKTCSNPFRRLVVAHNGNVLLCCMDWKQQFVAGNVHEERLWEIWAGERLTAARRMLQEKRREFTPCRGCDMGAGARAGLLPDVGEVGERDAEVLAELEAENGEPVRWSISSS